MLACTHSDITYGIHYSCSGRNYITWPSRLSIGYVTVKCACSADHGNNDSELYIHHDEEMGWTDGQEGDGGREGMLKNVTINLI